MILSTLSCAYFPSVHLLRWGVKWSHWISYCFKNSLCSLSINCWSYLCSARILSLSVACLSILLTAPLAENTFSEVSLIRFCSHGLCSGCCIWKGNTKSLSTCMWLLCYSLECSRFCILPSCLYQDQFTTFVLAHIWALYSVTVIDLYILSSMPHYFKYFSFMVSYEVRESQFFHCFCSPTMVCWVLGIFCFSH